MLVVRDDTGGLRAYRNVCRHRGSRLLSGSGQCKAAIRCRYHGWTYKLDGSLIGVPEGLAFGEKLDKPSLSLMPVRVEEMCGLVFVNLDADATPLAELVGDLPRRLAPYRIETLAPFAPAGGSQPANWKVVADNYIEGYHIPIAHPGLMRMLDYKHYDVEVNEHYVWFDAPMRDKPSSNRLERLYAQLVTPMPGLPPEDRNVWRYVYIYPNTTIDLYPDQVGTWQLLPDGVASTRDVSASYRPPGTSPRTRVVQWANQRLNTLVLDEDIDLVDNVQQGLQTRGYRCGPLSARETRGGVVRRPHPRRPGPGDAGGCDGLMATRRDGRERILAAAVGQIAREGIDGVRIARIAMEAGVSTAIVHYHFETREALLAEALEYSYARAGDVRVESDLPEGAKPCRATAVHDRPVPAEHAGARGGLGAVGGVVAARRPPPGAAARSPRSSTPACAPGLPARSPPGSGTASSRAAIPMRSPTARSRCSTASGCAR